ncbi:hypothetical protein [Streptomyces lancefieldiae]|uniref:Extensin n=1 Tax=Streptomyces lancefieldiae TaxID=3075520 RepID=A0ABU3AK24_9ACTN|nr:hypothetical protein [Streptomyces sp. DSM 40712]MDT0610308.1 hypothetical protein [Streptomyces sp. DSM 40712]
MADEQDRWLDRETAELLLRGESPRAVDPAARDRAERLAAVLGALSAPPLPTSEELPGEAAALAAFRKVRAERADAPTGPRAALGRNSTSRSSDTGLVRIGPRGDAARRPRWGRPLRLGLVAALTVGMVGGVAVAAGTGVLPTPFDGAEPDPTATVSAAASPDRPRASPSPLDGVHGGAMPGGTGPGAPGRGTARGDAGHGAAGDRDSGERGTGGFDGRRPDLAASCRDARAGRELDGTRRRVLKDAAGGSSRVGEYCADLLAGTDPAAKGRGGGRGGGESGESGEAPRGRGQGKDTANDTGDRDDKAGRDGGDGTGAKDGGDAQGGKGGKGGTKGNGGKGDKGGTDDDEDHHIARPVETPHGILDPRAPSASAPRPHPPHPSTLVGAPA